MLRVFTVEYLSQNHFFSRLINANIANTYKHIEIETESTDIILFERISQLYTRAIDNDRLLDALIIVLNIISVYILSLHEDLKR